MDKNKYFNEVFNQGQLIGTSHFGGDVAKTAAAGAAQRKILSPYSNLGVVGNGVQNFDSPVGGMSGQVTIPTSIAPAEILPITLDTTNEVDPVTFVLFDAKNVYKNSNCGSCGPRNGGGLIYSGSRDCSKYDSIVSALCSMKYILHSLRITVRGAGANPGSPTLDMPIKVFRGNLSNRTMQDSINPIDHVSPNQQDHLMVDIPLTDDKALLDPFTSWIVTVEPGLIVSLRGYVALRSAL